VIVQNVFGLAIIYWWGSLVPAAAVIAAPIAYILFVAVLFVMLFPRLMDTDVPCYS